MFRTTIVFVIVLLLAGCGLFQEEATPKVAPIPPPVEAVSCPEPEPEPCVCPEPEKIIVTAPAQPCVADRRDIAVIGQVEYVTVDATVKAKARIDTGAKTSSVHAEDIVEFDRDGKPWVRFTFNPEDGHEAVVMERAVARRVLIKRHGFDPQRRYVVNLGLAIGDIEEVVEVTLSDRSDFEFPVLIGRNFLTDNAVVDVSRKIVAQ